MVIGKNRGTFTSGSLFCFSLIMKIAALYILLVLGFGCSQAPQDQSLVAMSENPGDLEAPETSDNDLETGDVMNIEGQLICAHCHALNEKNVWIDHQLPESGFVAGCANLCAQQGYPIAVLLNEPVANTELWVVRTSSLLFDGYMASNTKIQGTFVTSGIIEPTEIKVQQDKTWVTLIQSLF